MLLRFRVSNFRSIKDEQELSMVASSLSGPMEALVHLEAEGLDALRVAAIYGANAAGKSNVLEALRFMAAAVKGSHRQWRPEGPIPSEPFLLDEASAGAPSSFEADLLIDGVRYRYGFKLDSKRILEEWLYAYPKRRERLWFLRDAQAFVFGKSLRGNNQTIASLTRENSLFLSAAAENNHGMLSPIHSWCATQLVFNNYSAYKELFSAKSFPPHRKALTLALVKLADVGVDDIELKEIPSDKTAKVEKALAALVPEQEPPRLDFSAWRSIELRHASLAAKSGIALPPASESQGTLAWLSLAGPLLDVLEMGAVLCVDELDRSLHPRLALEVVRIFEDPIRNPKNAQLIFNTHDTTLLGNLLGGPALRRDQVWFVEKDSGGATHLYPLTDFKPRLDENLERGYLQGRYGAIPFIASTTFATTEDG